MAKPIKMFLKSFTLIELIIVIAIIAVLGVAAFLVLTQWMSKGRDAQRISDLSTIKTALDIGFVKNGMLPIPDDKKDLLYSGTQILYQGKFGQTVVNELGSLTKIPTDRTNGEYDYSLVDDEKTYMVRAIMENQVAGMNYVSRVNAIEQSYKFIGKQLKGIVIENKFIYLPSMFATGYVGNKLDMLNDNPIFEGEKPGVELTGLVLENNNDTILAALTGMGISLSDANAVLSQAKGVTIQATVQKPITENCEGTLPANAQLNGTEKTGVNWTYSEIAGECKYKCVDGYYFTGGNCEKSKVVIGNASDGFVFYQSGVQVNPVSCNDLLLNTTIDYKSFTDGPWNGTKFADGIYWIKPNDSSAFKVYCDMTTQGGGWSVVANNYNSDREPSGCYAKVASSIGLVCGDGTIVNNDFALPSRGLSFQEVVWATYTGEVFSNISAYNYGILGEQFVIPNLNTFVVTFTQKNQTISNWSSKPKFTAEGKSLSYFGNKNALGYEYGTGLITFLSLNSTLSIDNLSFTDGYYDGTTSFSMKGFDDFQDGSGLGDVREPKSVRGHSSFIMLR